MTKIISAIFMFSLVLFSSVPGFAQDQGANKVYVVYLKDAKVDYYVVSNIQAVDFQGIKSLRGTAVNLPSWVKISNAIYFPVDKVATVVEFNSLNDYVTSTKPS